MKAIEAKRMLEERYKKQNERNKEKYDRVSVMFPSGYRDIVKGIASAGGKSLNGFIIEAVREKIERIENKIE